jgi:hypothetical protein
MLEENAEIVMERPTIPNEKRPTIRYATKIFGVKSIP